MQSYNDLQSQLKTIDHKSYPLYKSLRGSYQFPKYILSIDHVQGDPFAAPSDVRVTVDAKAAGFPAFAMKDKLTRTALADELLRNFAAKVNQFNFKAKGSGKSGLISVTHCGQEVLQRTACEISEKEITARFAVGFPANGRTINAKELEKILFEYLPQCVEQSFYYKNLNAQKVKEAVELAEDQQAIREKLPELGLAAFVADDSVLPRESGISSKPMKQPVKFVSPETMRVTLELPHRGKITGMGVPKGITLIVGGGYHGKSTLLNALELGVYNHIAGDGREYVIADETANPRYVAADLLSQAEHDELASAILITTSKTLADQVSVEVDRFVANLSRREIIEKSLNNYGYILLVDSLDEAADTANEIASEHLEILTKDPFAMMTKIRNAGAIFLGEYSSEPLGDYFAGPNHVLPTNGTARFFSPLNVDDFLKKTRIISYSRPALEKIHQDIECFAENEGLTAHANSIRVRFEKED